VLGPGARWRGKKGSRAQIQTACRMPSTATVRRCRIVALRHVSKAGNADFHFNNLRDIPR
jgi:hypothetical protein